MKNNSIIQPFSSIKLLNNEGYPSKECLVFIRTYKPNKSLDLFKFIENFLNKIWYNSRCGVVLHRKYNNKQKLELHTFGWKGNENIIKAIISNKHLTDTYMKYVMWKNSGHYYFEINITDNN
jgi:hypothetical protein